MRRLAKWRFQRAQVCKATSGGSSLAVGRTGGGDLERAWAFAELASRFIWLYDAGIRLLPTLGLRLRRALVFIQGPRVLEVSFGTGYLMSQYAGRFSSTGLDCNLRMIAATTKRLAKAGVSATLVHGDAHALPFPDNSFDTLVDSDAFTLYRDPQQAMAEFYRVLVPGGRLVLLEYNYPKDRNRLGMFWMHMTKLLKMPYVDFDPLLASVGFEFEDHPVGLSGCLHLYLAHKPLANARHGLRVAS